MLDFLTTCMLVGLAYWVGLCRGRRQGREIREMDDDEAEMSQMMRHLDKRISEVFTPEEWAATEKRCKAMLGEQ
jgi:hypothetical protein